MEQNKSRNKTRIYKEYLTNIYIYNILKIQNALYIDEQTLNEEQANLGNKRLFGKKCYLV